MAFSHVRGLIVVAVLLGVAAVFFSVQKSPVPTSPPSAPAAPYATSTLSDTDLAAERDALNKSTANWNSYTFHSYRYNLDFPFRFPKMTKLVLDRAQSDKTESQVEFEQFPYYTSLYFYSSEFLRGQDLLSWQYQRATTSDNLAKLRRGETVERRYPAGTETERYFSFLGYPAYEIVGFSEPPYNKYLLYVYYKDRLVAINTGIYDPTIKEDTFRTEQLPKLYEWIKTVVLELGQER